MDEIHDFLNCPQSQHNNQRKLIIYWQIVFIIGLWKL